MCSYGRTLQGHRSLSQSRAVLYQLYTFLASHLQNFTGGFGNSRSPEDPPSPPLGRALERGISLQGGNCRKCSVMGRCSREHPDSTAPAAHWEPAVSGAEGECNRAWGQKELAQPSRMTLKVTLLLWAHGFSSVNSLPGRWEG